MSFAKVDILIEGYTNAVGQKMQKGQERSCPTVSLVRDNSVVIVVDPGVLENQQILINKLEEHGLSVNDVTHIFVTHSHLDHYRNIGMFPEAKVVEFFWSLAGKYR